MSILDKKRYTNQYKEGEIMFILNKTQINKKYFDIIGGFPLQISSNFKTNGVETSNVLHTVTGVSQIK